MTETTAFGVLAASLFAAPLGARAVARRGGAVAWVSIAGGFLGTGLSFLLDHMIAFTRASAGEIEVMDPATGGRRTRTRAQFEAEWKGQAILVVPREE